MDISSASPYVPGTGLPARPNTPEEAARAFEAVLVRQMVQVMTSDLFKSSASGPMTAGAADAQRDALVDTLTDHLVASDSMRLRDLLLRQWGASGSDGKEVTK